MNIIIEPHNLSAYTEKYTVLELDTIKILPENRSVTAYCVVEQIPISELETIDAKRQLHQRLLENYKTRNWEQADQLIEQLIGSWGGELDSFYEEIRGRIAKYIDNDPGKDWDATIEKTVTTE